MTDYYIAAAFAVFCIPVIVLVVLRLRRGASRKNGPADRNGPAND